MVGVELARSGAFKAFFFFFSWRPTIRDPFSFQILYTHPCIRIKVSCSTTFLYAILAVFYTVMLFPVSAEIDSVTCSQLTGHNLKFKHPSLNGS